MYRGAGVQESWAGEFLEGLQRADGAGALIAAFDGLVRERGGTGFVSTSHAGAHASCRADTLLYTSMPDVFSPLDDSGAWWDDDPSMDVLEAGATRPFDFDGGLMSQSPYAAARYEVMIESGLGFGKVFPSSGGGQVGGVLVFADPMPGGRAEIAAAGDMIHLGAMLLHGFVLAHAPEPGADGVIRNRLSPALVQPQSPAETTAAAPEKPLAPREIDCLSWCAMGKTAEETAIILGLSVYTVRHYLRSATAKLGARTQAQAVALALKSRQLSL